MPTVRFDYPTAADVAKLPHVVLMTRLMFFRETISASTHWLHSLEKKHQATDRSSRVIAMLAGLAWTYEAIKVFRQHVNSGALRKTDFNLDQKGTEAWDRLVADPLDDFIKFTKIIRNKFAFHMDEDRVEGYLSQITDIDDLPPLFETNEQIEASAEGSWYDRAMVFGLGPAAAEALTQIDTADRLKSAGHLMGQVRRLFDALVGQWLVREEVKYKPCP